MKQIEIICFHLSLIVMVLVMVMMMIMMMMMMMMASEYMKKVNHYSPPFFERSFFF